MPVEEEEVDAGKEQAQELSASTEDRKVVINDADPDESYERDQQRDSKSQDIVEEA